MKTFSYLLGPFVGFALLLAVSFEATDSVFASETAKSANEAGQNPDLKICTLDGLYSSSGDFANPPLRGMAPRLEKCETSTDQLPNDVELSPHPYDTEQTLSRGTRSVSSFDSRSLPLRR